MGIDDFLIQLVKYWTGVIGTSVPNVNIRAPGGGRKKSIDKDPTFMSDLENLIEPTNRGDPESPLRWTSKSARKLAEELLKMGHKVTHARVADMLHMLGYSLQANRKTIEGTSHPDRDQQFNHINEKCKEFQEENQPVISVDTKKKELSLCQNHLKCFKFQIKALNSIFS